MKIMEWNIHGAASMGWNNDYSIKKFVVDRIIAEKADIVILVEFLISQGWDYLQSKLKENNYIWFMTYTSSQNGILIAINKNIDNLDLNNIEQYQNNNVSFLINTNIAEMPDFLQVKLEINKRPLIIIGTRIRVETDKYVYNGPKLIFKQKQFEALDEHLSSLNVDNIICSGDFNAYWSYNWKTNSNTTLKKSSKLFELHTPVWNPQKGKYSYVLQNDSKVSFDHIISKGIVVSNEDYLWDFISKENGYDNVTLEKYKSHLKSLPDHAILIANIEM